MIDLVLCAFHPRATTGVAPYQPHNQPDGFRVLHSPRASGGDRASSHRGLAKIHPETIEEESGPVSAQMTAGAMQ